MRALLVLRDPETSSPLERVLLRRGWEVARTLAAAGAQRPARMGGAAARLAVVEMDGAGDGVRTCTALRARTTEPLYLIGVVPVLDPATAVALTDARLDDLVVTSAGEPELEARIALAELRLAASRATPAQPAGDLGEIRRELHVQQAFLEALFESAPEGVVILDADSRVVRVNGEFTRIFGYSNEDARGRPLNDLIVPDELRTEGAALDGGLHRGERVMVETVRRHRDGHPIDVSVVAMPIYANGPVGAFSIYRDITEKKEQEAALRESEARYRALFDQSPIGVFLCDRDLRISHCNVHLTRLVGATYEQIVGADLLSLRDSRLLPGLRSALGGEPAYYEGPYRARTGKQLHVTVQYAPLRNEDGEVIGGIGVLGDISGRVEAERQRRAQAAEMERVNAALRERTLELEAAMQARSRLYTGMNHELRTPISAVLLYQELLIAGSLGPLSADQIRALEHSHTATRHLLDLVRDILDLSKIEAGRVSVQLREVCLETLLLELKQSVAPLTERHGSRLHLELDPTVGSIVTDPQRLRQILLNLVSNAAKFGRRRPIVLRTRRSEEGELLIEVVDQGIGIASEDLEQIFEDFVQLGTVGADGEGTGLGLAISRRLADLLEGRLEVESQLGVGSTFRLVLAGVREPVAAAPTRSN